MELVLKRTTFTKNSTIGELTVDGVFEKVPGIYKIVSPSNKIYIGQSINIYQRMKKYKHLCSSERMRKLYNSFKKYGISAHKFTVITYCTEDELNTLEQKYILELDTVKLGLNCRTGGNFNSKISQEGKDAISKAQIKYWEENRVKRSGINHPVFGKHFNKTHCANISSSRIEKGTAKRGNNPKAKLVLNQETGIYYDCLLDALDAHGLKLSTALRLKVKNNKINLKYA